MKSNEAIADEIMSLEWNAESIHDFEVSVRAGNGFVFYISLPGVYRANETLRQRMIDEHNMVLAAKQVQP